MKGSELLDKMELTEPAFISEAEEKKPRRPRLTVLIAACTALALSIAVIPLAVKDKKPGKDENAVNGKTAEVTENDDKSTEKNDEKQIQRASLHEQLLQQLLQS